MKNLKQLILALLLCCTSVMAWAYDFEVNGIYYNITSNTEPYTVMVTSENESPAGYGNNYSDYIVIPENVSYNNVIYSVTEISDFAFAFCTGIISVSIPNSVTTIGINAFSSSENLIAINVDSGNTHYKSINGVFFNYAANMLIKYPEGKQGDYVIPNTVTTIETTAFQGCTKLTSINIPNSVTTIKSYAFNFCTGLVSVSIPNSVTTIGRSAFDNTGWYNNQPDGILYLDNWCLGYKGDKPTGLLSIEQETKGIASNTFMGCDELTSVIIPNSVTTIGFWTFASCTGLTSVTIGNSVKTIGENTFRCCSGLTSIIIPNSVTTIGENAFIECTGLTSVTIGNSVTTIGENAFNYCTGLNSVIIPNSVITIGERAFLWCLELTSVSIGNSVKTIGDGAFDSCSGLTSVIIPNSVTTIGRSAFDGCTDLTSVTIGNSVTSIGDFAFYNCTGLNTMIALGNTPPSLGFDGCSNIESLVVCCGNKEAYEASVWSRYFSTIEEDCNLYEITTGETVEGGSIEISEDEASLGETVLVYVTVEDGYEIENIVACNANDTTQLVPISLVEDRVTQLTYGFTMMQFPVKVKATFRSTEGIGEGNNIATTLYPNPTNGKVTIEAENMHRVSVFNLMGQKIMESTASGNSFECDMSRYGVGVYMMQIETSNGIATKRVVVEK